jgi:hypothetical protein
MFGPAACALMLIICLLFAQLPWRKRRRITALFFMLLVLSMFLLRAAAKNQTKRLLVCCDAFSLELVKAFVRYILAERREVIPELFDSILA